MADSPRFTHVDDLKWQEVCRQRHGSRTASVYERWLDLNDRFLSLYTRWDPGMMSSPTATTATTSCSSSRVR